MKKWKKGMALALAAMLIGTTVDISAFAAEETGTVICDHHTEHTSDCGYTEATAGADCTHEHSDDCYSEVTVCVHSHDESCGYSEGEEGSPCNHAHDETCGENGENCTHTEHTSDCGYAEAQEGSPCSHECSEETGCVKVEENCQHTEHDANCGYKETVEGTPCNYTCTECVQTDDDKKQNEEQQEEEPAECTCTEKCTEEVVNTDCAVCSALDADITCCVGEETLECTCGTDDDAVHATDCPAYVAPENPECYCVEKCTEDNINVWCDVCGVQGAEACQSQGEESAVTYEYETASATYLSCDENGQNWETKTCGAATVLTSEMTTLESGWYVLNSDVTFSDRITVSGTVNLILADGYTLTASQGVNVGKGNTLSIYGQSADTGAIRATGNEHRSGIGGGSCQSSGTIIIYGGSVTANGGTNAAGIGGGCEGSGGTTTIYGGVIEATGSNRYSWNGAAGIGGGTSNDNFSSGSSSGDIDVYGGIIFATGKNGADDIGGGYGAKGKGASDVTIECGLIFDRNGDGTVYGDFVLTSDFTLESDKSITIPGDATLTIAEDVTLTNNGTITYEAPTEGKGYTIDYVNEKITIDDKCETNTTENFTGTTITEKDLTENDFDKTVGYIRARVSSGITGTGTINQNTGTISIPSRPTLADLSIDNSAEGVVLSDAYYYSFESSTYDAGNWTKGNGNLVTVAPEQSIYIYKVATEESFRSEVQTLTAPARRTETPTGLGIAKEYPNEEDASDGRINGVTTDMEYRKQGADTWTACTGTEITGLTAGTYEVRYKATDTNYCGESSVTVVIEEAAVKGTQDTADMSYGDTVTLSVTDKEGNPFSNVTYKWYEQTGENWNEIAGQTASSYSTDTLNAGTYNIKCEITGTSFVYTWQFTEFTIGKATPSADAPTPNALTYDGTARTLITAGITSDGTMQYSLEENGTYSTVLPTGTNADTYTVWYKVVGDSNHNDTTPASVKVIIAPKAVTVTANAASKTYGDTDPTFTYMSDGLVTSDTLTGELSRVTGEEAGTYAITQGTLTNKNNPNYDITFTEGTFTISKADATITVGTSSYNKTYGDADFALENVQDTNSETDVTYTSSNEDVVTVSNGTVTIKGAGNAIITVSLAASTNYNAATDQTITITVAKAFYTVDEINKSYLYSRENADSINLAALLPTDCGTVSYGTPTTTGVTFSETPSVTDGVLSYKVVSGAVGNSGTITVVVTTQNYADITITVNVSLIDQLPVSVKEGEAVSLNNDTLTYGEVLSKLTFKDVTFVDDSGNAVAGTLAWKEPSLTPDAGTTSATWVFTPNNTEYQTIEGTVAITVNKATPNVSAVPTVAERTYHPLTALADNDLTGDVVTGVDGNTLAGTWSWQSTGVIPVVNNSGYIAVFTPTDTTNYETVTRTITVTVTKATPAVVTLPTATTITYGDALSASSLSGTAQYSSSDSTTVAGSFAWKDSSVKPAVADSNTTAYAVIFTPADGANYNTVETTATLTVNKAENAPNMPGSTMNVSNKYTKVGDVPLPDGWEWQDTDKETALEVDTPVTATAVYTGADKGNYENETVSISVTRNACDHVAGNILYTGEGEKAPTCTESGLGHKECTKCNTVMESGIVVNALGHTGGTATCKDKAVCTRCNQPYGSTNGSKHGNTEVRGYRAATCTSGGYTGDTYCKDCGTKLSSGTSTGATGHDYAGVVTTEPTADKEGVMIYTCSLCGQVYTESIAKTGNDGTDGQDGNGTGTEAPFIKDDEGKEGWDVIRTEVADTEEGDTVTVDMNGSTVVPGDVFNDIQGKDITMVFDMGNGITWSVNGKDITSDNVGEINFGVKVGADANNTIPVEIINKVTGERYYMNISLSYDGEFGFKAVMTLNVDAKNAGLFANLFYFNEQTGELEFICADEIAADGIAELTFTHASEYTIVIDKEAMGAATASDTSGVSSPSVIELDRDGNVWWIIALCCVALAAIVVVIIILKKKKQDEDAK